MEGLSKEEALKLKKDGKTNYIKNKSTKTHLRIIYESFFSFYNLILYGVAIIFILYSIFVQDLIPITKYGFLLIVLMNGCISFYTQERARSKIKKLNILTDSIYEVIREDEVIKIPLNEILLGETILLKSGDQVPADILILEGKVKVDESILTGESKQIEKNKNDELLSGSLIISGSIKGKTIKVGKDCYVNTLQAKVSDIKKKHSILETNLNKIIKILIYMMIPAAIIVFLKTYSVFDWKFDKEIITKTSTIIIGMIPIGMVLLSSVTLTSSLIKLMNHNVISEELYSLENLARINVLCLDKTGTITTNKLKVHEIISLTDENNLDLLNKYIFAFKDENKTSKALKDYFKKQCDDEFVISEINEFSSDKKCSSLKSNGIIYSFGAIEFISNDENTLKIAKEYNEKGYRTLVFTKNNQDLILVVLEDEIRENVQKSLDEFKKMGVDLKIISGDALDTVTSIAKKVEIPNYQNGISLENIKIEDIKDIALKYTIFARATPEQKEEIIRVLEENNQKVGYIGDGVNDIISLRRSTCSIALNSGAQSLKSVADFILVDDNFNSLSTIIHEGRRVVHNIERNCSLFLTKALFFFFNSIVSIFFIEGMLIDVESIYIFEFITVAICGFFLSLEKNTPPRLSENFVKNIIFKSFLSSGFLFLLILPTAILSNFDNVLGNPFGLTTALITFGGILILFNIVKPFNKYTLYVSIFGFFSSIMCIILNPPIFLSKNYLVSGESLNEQIERIVNGFFNFEVFKSFNYLDYTIFFGSFIIFGLIYVLINEFIEKKKIINS